MITDTDEFRTIENNKGEIVDRLDYKKMAMLVQGLYQVVLDNKSPKIPVELVKTSSDMEFSIENE